jgi:adenylate kinase family enzyme
MPFLLFVSGSSGAGKTTVLQYVKENLSERQISILHFDSIGIPSNKAMIRQSGSLERWQEATTHSWIEKIVREYKVDAIVILEGQVNPDFVTSGCAMHGLKDFSLILLDCEWELRCARLTLDRRQPELANADMKKWSDFLRNQALQSGVRVIDTTHRSVNAVAEELMALVPI